MTKEIGNIFEDYNKIEDNDNISTVDFIERHYSFLISYQTENITDIEDISVMFKNYFTALCDLGRFTTIISKRDEIKHFIEQLRDKSKLFNGCYIEVEYVFSEALTSNRNDYKRAIASLTDIQNIDPQSENIVINLRYAKLNLRRKIYTKIIIVGLIIAFVGLALRLACNKKIFWIIDTIGFGIFIMGYLIQYIDNYLTDKKPSH